MNTLLKEYLSWNSENHEFYMELKEHDAKLYDRLMPLYEVLNYIYEATAKNDLEFDDDLEKIFNVGLEYLHDQVQSCKLYLETTFKNDFHHFLEYDEMICTVLYIEDIRYELAEKNIEIDHKKLDELLAKSEKIIQEQKAIPSTYRMFVDDAIKKIIGKHKFNFYGIIDIFVDVAETLGIYLYEEEEIIIGKDL